jgi:large subunit ribosomal protein L15
LKLHELRSPEGSRTKKQRVGRGTGSGRGKTSGRGQKGQNARSEGFRLGFEGGQMPLAQRLPKLGGFKNPFKKYFRPINLTKLNRFPAGGSVDPDVLTEAGLVRPGEPYKVLGTGNLGRKLTVTAHAFSATARAAIEKAGGNVVFIGGEPVAETEPKPARKSKPKAAAIDDEDEEPKAEEPKAEEPKAEVPEGTAEEPDSNE